MFNVELGVPMCYENGVINWQRVAHHRLVDVAVVLLALFAIGRIVTILPHAAQNNDFAHYYLSSRLLLNGENPYRAQLEPLYQAHGFVSHPDVPTATNPPPLLWLFAPLAILPANLAFVLWVGVEVSSLTVILWLTCWLLGDRLGWRGWFLICAGVVSASAVYWHFVYSQVQLTLAALILTGFYSRTRGAETAACVVVAIAGLIKLFPLVLLPWFVWGGDERGRWRRAVVTGLALVAGVLATSPGLWVEFFRGAPAVLAAWAVNHTFNFTLPSFVANVGLALSDALPARDWLLIGSVLGVGFIATCYAACRWGSLNDEAQFSLLSIAMLAGNVTAWGHYLVCLIFPVATTAVWVFRHGSARRYVFLGLLYGGLNLVGTIECTFFNDHYPLKILANYIPLYAILVWAVWLISRKEADASR